MKKSVLGLGASLALISGTVADACTRFVYETGTGDFMVGRSMDWFEDTQSDIWAYPAGVVRGGSTDNAFEWTAKHGSIVTTIYDMAAVDGINDAGLVVNGLYLAESDYGDPHDTGLPLIHVGEVLQYVLDEHATVAEVVATFEDPPFEVIAPALPNGSEATGHFAITDATGDSAVIEYIDGAPVIHHSADYRVMTNSPPYEQQLAITAYWETVGGLAMLPGTHRAADRFARVSWNLGATPQFDDPRQSTAAVFSLIRSVSVPVGISDPDKPNIASTIWRTVSDIGEKRYYFDSAFNPSLFWVDVEKFDLAEGAQTLKLELGDNPILAGEVSASFETAEPLRMTLEE